MLTLRQMRQLYSGLHPEEYWEDLICCGHILGCDIVPAQAEETGAMGSAILGFAAALGVSPLEIAPRFWKYGGTIRPNNAHAEVYSRRYALYKQLRAFYKEI